LILKGEIMYQDLTMQIFHAALQAVDPYESVKNKIDKISMSYSNHGADRILVVGFGKASCRMAMAVEDGLHETPLSGSVITKYGHSIGESLKKIKIYEAAHPVPDKNGTEATELIRNLLMESDESTLVIALISGGGSALLVSPYGNITLEEKQTVTQLLLKAGADIYDLNTVRKHISKVKGGRLAETAHPSRVISLILSDVIGDRLDVIASGPTSPDITTFSDALSIFEKYRLTDKIPFSVLDTLKKGIEGTIAETPKNGHPVFENVENIIVGSNRQAIEAASEKSDSLALNPQIISTDITGEARDVGRRFARKAIEIKKAKKTSVPLTLISGGETTVTVRGNGLGGRNTELALSFAMEIEGMDGITFLSAGTDGTDGPTDAAGAIVSGKTLSRARKMDIDPRHYLAENDSYTFFKKVGGLFVTGPTGTNVMDIQIAIIE
jgi:hydroxypyruvate reductase/glycerate 2-kinase